MEEELPAVGVGEGSPLGRGAVRHLIDHLAERHLLPALVRISRVPEADMKQPSSILEGGEEGENLIKHLKNMVSWYYTLPCKHRYS